MKINFAALPEQPIVIERIAGFWSIRLGGHVLATPWTDDASAVLVALWLKAQGIKQVQVQL